MAKINGVPDNLPASARPFAEELVKELQANRRRIAALEKQIENLRKRK